MKEDNVWNYQMLIEIIGSMAVFVVVLTVAYNNEFYK